MADNNYFIGAGIEELSGKDTTKSLHMIFLVDNSGSMRGVDSTGTRRIDAVNQSFQKMIPALQNIQSSVNDAFTIFISIMAFNQDPEWITLAQPISSYVFSNIPESEWVTYFSEAYKELDNKLSRNYIFSQRGKMARPYIMLMTDGAPTEGDPYLSVIDSLKKNGWFDLADRYAVLIGRDTVNDMDARDAVKEFVSDPEEGIIDAAEAKQIIETVSAHTIVVADQMTRRIGPKEDIHSDSNSDSKVPLPWDWTTATDDFTTGGNAKDPWSGFDANTTDGLIDPNLVF